MRPSSICTTGPRFPLVPFSGPVPASMVGSIVLASEVSLLLLVPTSMTPTQIKCAKDILRYPWKLRDECLNTSWFWNLFDARKKISDWKTEYTFCRPHSSLGYMTPNEYARQWNAASLSQAKSMAVAQPNQGHPDGLRFAPP